MVKDPYKKCPCGCTQFRYRMDDWGFWSITCSKCKQEPYMLNLKLKGGDKMKKKPKVAGPTVFNLSVDPREKAIEVDVTKYSWYIRLWHLLSNPFTYVFKGYWRL